MSLPSTLNLKMYRGEEYTHELLFVDGAIPPVPWNLSDYTFKAQIRDRPEYGTIVYAEFEVDDFEADIGRIILNLAAGATRIPPGFWDLEVDDGFGPITILKGSVIMSGDVTQGVNYV